MPLAHVGTHSSPLDHFFLLSKIPSVLPIGSAKQERDNGAILGPHERHNPNVVGLRLFIASISWCAEVGFFVSGLCFFLSYIYVFVQHQLCMHTGSRRLEAAEVSCGKVIDKIHCCASHMFGDRSSIIWLGRVNRRDNGREEREWATYYLENLLI